MPPPNCLVPGCTRWARTRGLCLNHYRQMFERVQAGLTTWVAEEAAGRCLPVVDARANLWRFMHRKVRAISEKEYRG